MSAQTLARRAMISILGTTALLGLLFGMHETTSAFSAKTTNNGNSFGAASDFKTYLFTDDFASGSFNSSYWSNTATLSATLTVTNGAARMTTGSTYGSSARMLSAAGLGSPTNQGTTFRHRFNNASGTGMVMRAGVRCDGTYDGDAPTNCSWLEIENNKANTFALSAAKGTTFAPLATGSTTTSGTAWWYYRIEISGTTVRAKRWADGSSEPTSWNLTGSVPSAQQVSTGRLLLEMKLYGNSSGLTQDLDDVKYYTLP